MINEDLTKQVVPTESELKEIIVNYVGNNLNPDSDEITVEQVVEVFSTEFPEFLLVIAEENWINGYTQALNDVNYVKNNNELKKLHQKEEK